MLTFINENIIYHSVRIIMNSCKKIYYTE